MDQKTSICLPEADGYEITAGGGNWDGEISWTLYTYSEVGTVSTCPEPCDTGYDLHLVLHLMLLTVTAMSSSLV